MNKYYAFDIHDVAGMKIVANRGYVYLASEADALIAHIRSECDFHQRTSVKLGDINVERAARIALLRGALADIANSDDMTFEIARAKAKRIYDETDPARVL